VAAAGVLAATLALATGAGPAAAHDTPYSWLNLRVVPGRVEGRLIAHVYDLAHELGGDTAPESLLVEARARAAGPALWAILEPRFAVVADGDTLRPVLEEVAPDRERSGLVFRWSAPLAGPPAQLVLHARLFPYDPQHETYVNGYLGTALRHQDLLDRTRQETRFVTGTRPDPRRVFRRFVAAGVHHIFIGPDHVLFVVGLLLLGGSLGRLLKIITGFTVAHSITLAIATLGLWNPPARVIEPLIALSIVFIGLENLRHRGGADALPGGHPLADRRAWLAFGFGLVHGFGFAGVLREFGLPGGALGTALFSFNVGVELGQAAIVLACAPALALLRRASARAAVRVALAGSVVVTAAGAWWFVQRVLAG
jgi:hypothetical protein